jgi:hypothetical protein
MSDEEAQAKLLELVSTNHDHMPGYILSRLTTNFGPEDSMQVSNFPQCCTPDARRGRRMGSRANGVGWRRRFLPFLTQHNLALDVE